MKVYCDIESGEAFEDGYEWPDLPKEVQIFTAHSEKFEIFAASAFLIALLIFYFNFKKRAKCFMGDNSTLLCWIGTSVPQTGQVSLRTMYEKVQQ